MRDRAIGYIRRRISLLLLGNSAILPDHVRMVGRDRKCKMYLNRLHKAIMFYR